MNSTLTVCWISEFPVEWLSNVPEAVRKLPRQHPSSWQRVLLDEFKQRDDIKLHVVCLRKQVERDITFEMEGVTFHVLKATGGFRLASFFWQDTILIGRYLEKIRPDIVHAWGTERGAGLIALRLPYPFLVTMQGILEWCADVVKLPIYFRLMVPFERYTLRRAGVVTVESAFGARYLKNKYPHLQLKQVEHAPARFFHEIVRRPQIKPIRFLCIGTLGAAKGTDILLGALDQLKDRIDFRLRLIGQATGAFEPELNRWRESKLWEKVDYAASMSLQEIAQEISSATMMVFPTRADNSPNVVKEAVVGGLPVIASEVGGIPDYVVPNKNGLLFAPEDLTGCVSVIQLACEHPLFKRGMVDETVLREKRSYLSPATMALAFREAYDFVLGRERSNTELSVCR